MGLMNFINSDFSKIKYCSCVLLKFYISFFFYSKYEIFYFNKECWDILLLIVII